MRGCSRILHAPEDHATARGPSLVRIQMQHLSISLGIKRHLRVSRPCHRRLPGSSACRCNQDVCPSALDVETMLRSRVGSEGATSRARLHFVRISLNAVPSQRCVRWHDLHPGWIIRDLHDARAGTISHRTKVDLTKDCKSRPTGWIGGRKPPSLLARLTKWIVRNGRNFRQVLSRTTR